MRRCVTADHEIPERPPLILELGEEVEVGQRDETWPAFVFVASAAGSGWVPERHLEVDGERGRVFEPYDTTELPARGGELVEILREDPDSGWSWCRDIRGREGWVPDRLLGDEGIC